MFDFSEYYGLHDTMLNEIEVQQENLILSFDDGIYRLNPAGEEVELTSGCKILVSFQGKEFVIDNHIEIQCFYKRKKKYISLKLLNQMLKTKGASVYMDYYSPFSKTILLHVYLKKFELYIFLLDIKEVQILFIEEK